MPDDLSPEAGRLVALLVDEWISSMSPAQIKLTLYLIRHDRIGRRGLRSSERHLISRDLNVLPETVQKTLTQLVHMGVVHEIPGGDDVRFGVNAEWQPPKPFA